MGLEQVSAANDNFYAFAYSVEVDGTKVTGDILKSMQEIQVEEKIDVGAGFTIKLYDSIDPDKEEFEFLDNKLFTPGNEVTLKMGYGSKLETLMIGKITGLEPEFSAGQPITLIIEGQDLSYDFLKKQSPEKSFVEKSYADIVKEIANEAGMTPVVDAIATTDPVTLKTSSESYFQFLESLSQKTGFEFRVDGKTMYFVKPGGGESEILTLSLGKDINSFHPVLKTVGLYTEVEARGHNPEDPATPFVGIAKAGDEEVQESSKDTASKAAKKWLKEQKKIITNVAVMSDDHALAIAKASLNKASDTLIEGETECIGLPQIRTGVTIEIDKVGARFSGKYYVTETQHTVSSGGYKTTFKVRRNAI
jgi:phage protein D